MKRRAGYLFGVGSGVRESDGDLERAGADADLGAHRNVARPRAIVGIGQVAVAIAEVDLHVRGAVVAGGRPAERPDDAHPHVLLAHQQRRRMGIENLPEVSLCPWLPVRRRLQIKAHVGQLWSERGRDEEGVLLGIGEVLLGQSVFVVGAVDGEGGDTRTQPGDAVLPVGRVINRWRTSGRGKEAKLVKRDAIQERKEDLAERPVRERVPELAPRTRRRSKRHLATGTIHWRRAWSTWSLHRGLSMESG